MLRNSVKRSLEEGDVVIRISSLMGLESVLADELRALGYQEEDIVVDNALVSLLPPGGLADLPYHVAKCNICLRTAERVDLELAAFPAKTFDDVYEGIFALDWSNLITKDAAFVINGFTRKSKLHSLPTLQSVIKKAIVSSLQRSRGLSERSVIKEDPQIAELKINFSLMKDYLSLSMNTSGTHLHKRGYRKDQEIAPLRETLAAGLIYLSMWEPWSGELLYDPCCGSGTFLCEAALMAANIAPGYKRSFDGEKWHLLGPKIFAEVKKELKEEESREAPELPFIAGSDISPRALDSAAANLRRLGMPGFVDIYQRDLSILSAEQLKQEFSAERLLLIANPPYGERMNADDLAEVERINKDLGKIAFYPQSTFTKPGCRLTVITAADFEEATGHVADKRRKLYNGMLKTDMYHYFREKYID